jgi:redox-regulated HSP33 family molecular chaperone
MQHTPHLDCTWGTHNPRQVRCELCNEAYHFTEEEVLDYV